MLTRIIATSSAAMLALGVMACSPTEPSATAEAPPTDHAVAVKQTRPLAKMKDFNLKDQNGKAYDLYKFGEGAKAVVLTMHTKGCPIGQQLMPDFKDLQAKYEAKGVKFLMINANTHDTPAMIAAQRALSRGGARCTIHSPLYLGLGRAVDSQGGQYRPTQGTSSMPRARSWSLIGG